MSLDFFRHRWDGTAPGVIVIAGALLLPAPAFPQTPDPVRPATLVRADDAVITFRVDVPTPEFQPSSLEGFERIRLAGFSLSGNPGEPPVPTRPFLVAVPPGARASVSARIIASASAGSHRLEPYPTPVGVRDDEFGPSISERIVWDETVYRAWSPPALVEADEMAMIRRTRVLPLRVNPVAYDLASGEIVVATRIEIIVSLAGGDRSAPEGLPARPETPEWTGIFGRLVVNPEQGRQWRTPTAAAAVAAPSGLRRIPIPGTVKIRVRETAVHAVGAGALVAAGFPAGQPVTNLRLFKRNYDETAFAGTEQSVPLYVREDPAGSPGVFDGNDLLIFYGLRLRDDASKADTRETFADHNVYWLEASAGAAMASRTPAAGFVSADTASASFPATAHAEIDLDYRERTPTTVPELYYYNHGWERDPVDMPFDLDAIVPGSTLQLSAELHGWTSASRTIRLSLVNSKGEKVLASGYPMPGYARREFSTPVAAADLDVGTNQFRLARPDPNDPNRTTLQVILNWIELSYTARYRARGNTLRFTSGSLAGDTTITVTGLSTNTGFELFDVTAPESPVRLALGPGHFTPVAGGFALAFRETQSAGRRFVLVPVSRMIQVAPADIVAEAPAGIIGSGAENGVDVLVVSHAMFIAQMQEWASYRRSQGYRVYIVDVDNVFDEFNGGVPSPYAIYRFTRHFFERGNAGALVLVGDASKDEKTIHSDSAPNFVPSMLRVDFVGALNEYEVVSTDKRFVKLPGPGNVIDDYPDLIVGRLPVGSTGELEIMLAKILKYEAPSASDFWRKRMIFVADDTFSEGQASFGGFQYCCYSPETGFESSEDEIAGIVEGSPPAGYDVVRFFLSDYTDAFYPPHSPCTSAICASQSAAISFTRANVTDKLMNELNQGATLVTIQAHMNRYTVTHERLLSTEDAAVLGATGRDHLRVQNRGMPWILFAMGCHFSDYSIHRELRQSTVSSNRPNGDAFGEQFLFQNDRGAVATYASAGYEFLGPNTDYLEDMTRIWFYEAPFDTMVNQTLAEWKLGQLMFLTEARMAQRGQRDPVERYHILGDPLLRIDAGPPAFDVTVDGASVRTGDIIESGGEGDLVDVVAVVTDENAIRRFSLEIDGQDTTDSLTIEPLVDAGIPRARQYRLSFSHKLRPESYDIVMRAFQAPDTLAGQYHIAAEFKLRVESSISVAVNGRIVSSGSTVPANGSYRIDLSFPVFIPASEIGASIDDVDIPALALSHPSEEDSLRWIVTFQQSLAAGNHTLKVTAGTNEFSYILVVSETAGLRYVINYPNPFREQGTSFVYTNDVEILDGSIDIFTTSGKRVRSLPIPPASRTPGQNAVFWDGLDASGGNLANGVYLYVIRVTQRGGSATVRGKMSRLH